MLKHYLKTAISNIIKDKIHTFINILGLAIGLSCSFFMLIYILNEYSYDRMHKKSDRIFRVLSETSGFVSPSTPLILGPTLKEEYPEIEKYTRINLFYQALIKKGTEYEKSRSFFCVDNDVFDIFTFPLISGDKDHLLTEPNSVVLSEKMAMRYFKEPNPIGKNLEIKYNNDTYLLKVTGIMNDIPEKSTFRPEMLTNLSFAIESINNDFYIENATISWLYGFSRTYILLKENHQIADLEKQMPDFEKRHNPKERTYKFSFQALKDVYLHSENLVNNGPVGDLKSIRIFSIISALILFIAAINYIILSTARAVRRNKEIGMRKVFGANKGMLVRQVLSESVLTTLIALPLAILFVKIFLPNVNKLFDKDLVFSLSESGSYFLFFSLITLIIGLISGSYLSVNLARLQPVSMLRNKIMAGNQRNYFRKAMVIFQLIIFIVLCLCTSIVFLQLRYIHQKDMGFNKENLLIINCPEIGEKYISFKNEIKTNTNIINACGAMNLPPDNNSGFIECQKEDDPTKIIKLEGFSSDCDFIKTFQIKISQGEDFPVNYKRSFDSCLYTILNESAVRELGIKKPVNHFYEPIGKIIGVVKDFNLHSIHTKIPPLTIWPLFETKYINQIAVRIKPENKTETINYLKDKWKEFSKEPFEYYFIDEILDDLFKKENQQAKIMRIFSFFAIFIAMLGLFGLSLFTSQQRTKEIGIRKVHGASIGDIMRLLSREYIMLVVIANILAAPLAYYFMDKWLQNFAYHTKIAWWLFGLVFLLSLVIVLLTVSWQAYKAAKTNPVETLKYE